MDTQTHGAQSGATFRTLGLAPKLIEILDRQSLTTPTPIQAQAIPQAIEGKDVIGVAQTGTGKTLAFGLPLIQRIAALGGNGLILAPTRELALQIDETLSKYGRELGLKGAILIGGASMNTQIASIRRGPNVVIATPGRLLDHMRSGSIRLDAVSILVLDEADRMLDMGFWPQIREIIKAVPVERQTMLFSATLSREITDLATKHMKMPTSIEVAPPGTTADKVSQEFFIVHRNEKLQLLESVLGKYHGSTIVFSRTKHGAKRIAKAVRDMGHTASEIHSNKSLSQRREALEGFKTGKYRVLIATDIAARGIDVKGIELVINYDIPGSSEDYVHRIGRTARAGTTGHAISFAMPEEKRSIRDIENLIRRAVPISALPPLPPARQIAQSSRDEDRPRSFRGGRPSFGGNRSSGARSFRSGPRRGR